MQVSDIVSMFDKKYTGSESIQCPNEGKPVKSPSGRVSDIHGNLVAHASGAYLICGNCGYQHFTARP